MKPPPDDRWTPSPELLAAYGDGELDCRPDLSSMRLRIEEWLGVHADAVAELNAQGDLSHIMAATTPEEPSQAQWGEVWNRVLATGPIPVKRRPIMQVAGLVAAGVAAALLWIMSPQNKPPAPTDTSTGQNVGLPQEIANQLPAQARKVIPASGTSEVLEMITAEEVEIIHVAGPDTLTLLIGRLPMSEPMTLLQAHEVQFTPPANAEAGTELRICGNCTPVIWTPLPHECKKNH